MDYYLGHDKQKSSVCLKVKGVPIELKIDYLIL